MVCLYAKQNFMQILIFTLDIMAVIRYNKRYITFFRKLYYVRIYAFLLKYSVVLKFKKEIIFAKNSLILQSFFLCKLIISTHKCLRNFTRKTSRKCNYSLVIFFQEFLINSRFTVKTVYPSHRNKLYQILIADIILAQKHHMAIFSI